MFKRILFTLCVLAVLSGCTSRTAQPSLTPTGEVVHTSTPTLSPSPTPLPPSATPTAAPTETPIPTATPEPQDSGPASYPSGINPLTGLAPAQPGLLERRPLAVKIQIFPRGQRPAWGISQADIVYDYYQNNGLTRFHAIFYGQQVEKIGPIRSARLLDDTLVRMYRSIFAFGGADRRILARLFSAEYSDRLVVEGGANCPPMCREDPNTYNFLTTSTMALSAYASSQGIANGQQDLHGMSFQYEPPANGQPGSQVAVRYSISAYTRWDYDPASGRYLRFQDTVEDTGGGEVYEPMIDRNDETQIAAENVVVLLAPHSYFYQSGQNEIIEIQLTGSGKAFAFRDGQVYEVLWNQPGDGSVLSLTNTDGSPFPFKHGSTWFQVVGAGSRIQKQDADGAWRFEMRIP